MTKPPIREVVERYGFDPEQRAARGWLWDVAEDGRLMVVASSGVTFDEANYDGNGGPMVGGDGWAEHFWKAGLGRRGRRERLRD